MSKMILDPETTLPLKPCPFCGGDALAHSGFSTEDEFGDYIACEDCDSTTWMYGDMENSVEIWNSRDVEDDLRMKVLKLEAALRFYSNDSYWKNGDVVKDNGGCARRVLDK